MQEHLKLTDEEFEKELTQCTLALDLFTHQAHLRFAWIQLRKHGINKAPGIVSGMLKKYIYSLGEDCKYNETVTIAAVHTVNRFMRQSNTDSFTDFIKENATLHDNFKALLLAHYRTDIFKSKLAKKEFIAPDLLPFD